MKPEALLGLASWGMRHCWLILKARKWLCLVCGRGFRQQSRTPEEQTVVVLVTVIKLRGSCAGETILQTNSLIIKRGLVSVRGQPRARQNLNYLR